MIAPAHSHLTICVAPNGDLEFYPEGDRELLVRGLRKAVAMFKKHPDRIRCAAGACRDHGHNPREA